MRRLFAVRTLGSGTTHLAEAEGLSTYEAEHFAARFIAVDGPVVTLCRVTLNDQRRPIVWMRSGPSCAHCRRLGAVDELERAPLLGIDRAPDSESSGQETERAGDSMLAAQISERSGVPAARIREALAVEYDTEDE